MTTSAEDPISQSEGASRAGEDETAEVDPPVRQADDVDAVPAGEDQPWAGESAEPLDSSPSTSDVVAELVAARQALEASLTASRDEVRNLKLEAEELRRWQLTQSMKPAFQQLAALHADLLKAADAVREGEHAEMAGDYEHFAEVVVRVMDLFDLESVGAAPGLPFDSSVHAAVMTRKTADEAADQTVARVVRQGFRALGDKRVLLPAKVIVHRYDPTASGDSCRNPASTASTHPDMKD